MAKNSAIEWTDATWNGWWGCTKVSPACDHCYAEGIGQRFGVKWGAGESRKFFGDRHWDEPLKWNTTARKRGIPLKVFANSMADVFDNEVGQEHRDRLWSLIRRTPWLKWLLLTKRIGNARDMLPADWGDGYQNVGLGSTVVTQPEADRDIGKLKSIPARMRFLSCEPLLDRIDLRRCRYESCPDMIPQGGGIGHSDPPQCCEDPAAIITGIDWVIAGGESGRAARASNPDHLRYLRDQCVVSGVPFFFKQWGEWVESHDMPAYVPDVLGDISAWMDRLQKAELGGHHMVRTGKEHAGSFLDGREHMQFPQWVSEKPTHHEGTQ